MTTGLLPRQVESQDIEETQKKENEERLKNFKLLIEKAQPKSESISEASKSVSNSEDNKNPPKGIGEYNPFPELQTKPNEIVASRHASNRIRGIEIRPSWLVGVNELEKPLYIANAFQLAQIQAELHEKQVK